MVKIHKILQKKFRIYIEKGLSDPSSKRNWNIYLKRSGIITKFLKKLQHIDCNEKNISIENSEESEKYWNEAYQDLVNEFQSNIFMMICYKWSLKMNIN